MSHDGQHMSDLAAVFQRLQSVLLSTSGIEAFLQQLSELATGAADQPISCGITARRDGQPLTVASSDHQASMLDESQYTGAEGPCLHTLATGQTTLIEDIDQEIRWPRYVASAKAAGLRCSLSLPLTVDHTTVGAMNLYGFASAGYLHRRGPAALRAVRRAGLRGPATNPGPGRRSGGSRPGRSGPGFPQHHRPGPRHCDGPTALHCRGGLRAATDAVPIQSDEAPRRRRRPRCARHRPTGATRQTVQPHCPPRLLTDRRPSALVALRPAC